MASHLLSPDTQAVLLLCGSLGRRREGSANPLTTSEYGRLAQWLHQQGLRPGDLLGGGALENAGDPPVDRERIASLLERGAALALEVERWTNRGLWVLSRGDEGYPRALRTRLGKLAPPLLYGAGDPALLGNGGLAVVGSRDADAAAECFARLAGATAARQNVTIVSGAARGVDSFAMSAALDAGGRVAGILTEGLDRAATSGRYRDALRSGLLVLASPYDPGARFSVHAAMGRNKIVYGLSHWGLVVNSAVGKGGTWAGAIENLRAGWVPLFVRDEADAPDGNRALLREGAIPLRPHDLERTEDLSALLGSLASAPGRQSMERTADSAPDLFTSAADAPAPTPDSPAPSEGLVAGDAAETPGAQEKAGGADLFNVVWPHIEQVLATPQSDQAVAAALNIQPGQARAWLHHAVELGKAQRLSRPARYGLPSSAGNQLQLLDPGPAKVEKRRSAGTRRGKQQRHAHGQVGGD
jgi:predicted Rossmann fold nucleotide-binding protein DprA/Smf involved in DNA uptake